MLRLQELVSVIPRTNHNQYLVIFQQVIIPNYRQVRDFINVKHVRI